MKPTVSVVMPAYNAERFIHEAIESILGQSFTDFEFLIIEDGSTDATRGITDQYKAKDKRIRVLYNDTNKGLIYSLNRALDVAEGQYIARMDADDVSLPQRLEIQVSFMDSNGNIAVSSAWMKTLGKVKEEVWKSPLTHEKIMAKMFCYNCLWHPVSIIRKEVLDSLNLQYDNNYNKAEDYKLWLEISKHAQLANIPEVIHRYRIHNLQKTKTDHRSKKRTKKNLRHRRELPGIREEFLMNFLSREITIREVELHAKLFFEIPFTGSDELDNLRKWVDFLISVNKQEKRYVEPDFSRNLKATFANTKAKSFKHFCNSKKRYNPVMLRKLFFSDYSYYSCFSKTELMMLVINSLVFRKNRKNSGKK